MNTFFEILSESTALHQPGVGGMVWFAGDAGRRPTVLPWLVFFIVILTIFGLVSLVLSSPLSLVLSLPFPQQLSSDGSPAFA